MKQDVLEQSTDLGRVIATGLVGVVVRSGERVHKQSRRIGDVVNVLYQLHNEYDLVLLTRSDAEFAYGKETLRGLYNDIMPPATPCEGLDRFVQMYGRPRAFIFGDRSAGYEHCKATRIRCGFINMEGKQAVPGVQSIYSPVGLRNFLENPQLLEK